MSDDLKRINWLRVFLMGFATYAATIGADDICKAILNEPTVFKDLPFNVWSLVHLKAAGAAAFTISGLLMDGYHSPKPKPHETTPAPPVPPAAP